MTEFRPLSDAIFHRIAGLIFERTGIHLDDSRKKMLESRLRRVLRARQLTSFEAYWRRLQEQATDEEILDLINAVSTNTTHFFREEGHFQFLRDTWKTQIGLTNPIRVWCAASSSGEEPYSIAITIRDALPGRDLKMLASDIDTNMLKAAKRGIYKLEAVADIPLHLKKKFLLKGKGANSHLVQVKKELRDKIEFKKINLIEPYPLKEPFDLIFCRNVMIYFITETKRDIVERMVPLLKPGGYLIIGMAETLKGVTDKLKYVAPAVYRREN